MARTLARAVVVVFRWLKRYFTDATELNFLLDRAVILTSQPHLCKHCLATIWMRILSVLTSQSVIKIYTKHRIKMSRSVTTLWCNCFTWLLMIWWYHIRDAQHENHIRGGNAHNRKLCVYVHDKWWGSPSHTHFP